MKQLAALALLAASASRLQTFGDAFIRGLAKVRFGMCDDTSTDIMGYGVVKMK